MKLANYQTPNERSHAFDAVFSVIFGNQWLVLIIISIVLLTVAAAGYFAGLKLHKNRDEEGKAIVSGVQATVLGLLGLLLGFTFSMSLTRYEARRDLVMEEANSIGTTFLRAAFLPPAEEVLFKQTIKDYVEARISFYDAGSSAAAVQLAESNTAVLQQKLWVTAETGVKSSPTPLSASLITSLNETIDLDSERVFALNSRIPAAVWLLVLIVAGAGCFASGYTAGANGAYSVMANVMLPILITIVITLIADFDRPRRGLVGISQRPLLSLRALGEPVETGVKHE